MICNATIEIDGSSFFKVVRSLKYIQVELIAKPRLDALEMHYKGHSGIWFGFQYPLPAVKSRVLS